MVKDLTSKFVLYLHKHKEIVELYGSYISIKSFNKKISNFIKVSIVQHHHMHALVYWIALISLISVHRFIQPLKETGDSRYVFNG